MDNNKYSAFLLTIEIEELAQFQKLQNAKLLQLVKRALTEFPDAAKEFPDKVAEVIEVQNRIVEDYQNDIAELKEDADDVIQHCEEAYLQTGNVLYLWSIYRVCRLVKRPVPEQVLAYLDACAERLEDVQRRIPYKEVMPKSSKNRKVDEAHEVQKALGLGVRGKNHFIQRRKHDGFTHLMHDMVRYEGALLVRGVKPTSAQTQSVGTIFAAVERAFGESRIGLSTLYKRYRKYKAKRYG